MPRSAAPRVPQAEREQARGGKGRSSSPQRGLFGALSGGSQQRLDLLLQRLVARGHTRFQPTQKFVAADICIGRGMA